MIILDKELKSILVEINENFKDQFEESIEHS